VELVRLGEARQTSLSEQAYALFAEELIEFDMRDVRAALRGLAREPKADYQKSFPDLGTLIERIQVTFKQRTLPPQFIQCGECLPGGFVFVDAKGEPCDASESPDRRLGYCSCKRQWLAAKGEAEGMGAMPSSRVADAKSRGV
jgi:hypothetical protein